VYAYLMIARLKLECVASHLQNPQAYRPLVWAPYVALRHRTVVSRAFAFLYVIFPSTAATWATMCVFLWPVDPFSNWGTAGIVTFGAYEAGLLVISWIISLKLWFRIQEIP